MLWLCLMIWQVQVIPLKWEEEIAQRVKIFFHLLVIKAFTLFLFFVWIYSPYHFPESHQEASLKIDEDEVQSRKWSLIVSNKTIASDTWEIADGRCQRPLNWEMPRGFCRTLTSLIIRILLDLSPYASFFLFFSPFWWDREKQHHWIPKQKSVNISIQVLNRNNGYNKTYAAEASQKGKN